ncbi:MAG: hypothetical protein LQ352_004517, partial [Teloschistes flavicans]
MASQGRAYHADSDADDEYERSEITSPTLPIDDDDDISTENSDPPSTEPTPTFDRSNGEKLSPKDSIIQWSTGQCADFVSSIGLPQYCDKIMENDIVGEALIALKHEELKEMNIISVGHRLTILKGVYDVKVRQEVPIESDHYIPPSADADANYKPPSEADYNRLVKSIIERDERIIKTETALIGMAADFRRLREEVLPIIRMAKDRSHPLPYHPNSHSPDLQNNHEDVTSPVVSQMPPEKPGGSSLSRKFSTKRLWLGNTPKSSSPTHVQSIPENRSMGDNLDPSAAATAASSHLTASMSGGPQPSTSPNQVSIPSPTSPNTYANQPTLNARAWNGREVQTPGTARSLYSHAEDASFPHNTYASGASTLVSDRERNASNPTPTPNSNARNRQPAPQQSMQTLRDAQLAPQDDNSLSSSMNAPREPPSVEIFKSFRVSMEDPCHKVLPAALKKYNIIADWRQYALYIVFGDQERCLGMDEKPLILFKQLDREGKKPMFMLRRHAAPVEGHSGPAGMSHQQHTGTVGGMGWDSGPSGMGSLAKLDGSRGIWDGVDVAWGYDAMHMAGSIPDEKMIWWYLDGGFDRRLLRKDGITKRRLMHLAYFCFDMDRKGVLLKHKDSNILLRSIDLIKSIPGTLIVAAMCSVDGYARLAKPSILITYLIMGKGTDKLY